MKQATKKMVSAGVANRFVEAWGGGGTLKAGEADKIVHTVTDTILSAIRNGYDKIRVNDQLHLRVKIVKGARVKPSGFMAGSKRFPTLDADGKCKLPDRVVITLVSTPDLDAACMAFRGVDAEVAVGDGSVTYVDVDLA